MEAGLAKLDEVWGRVAFNFAPHKEGSGVSLVKMAEEDFEVGAWARLHCGTGPSGAPVALVPAYFSLTNTIPESLGCH
jgi:hypothetical protein